MATAMKKVTRHAAKKQKPAAAKKSAAPPAMTAATPASVNIGDVVKVRSDDGTVSGPGRVCSPPSMGYVSVMFGEGIGCVKVSTARLIPAPGADAPACGDCG